MQIEGYPILQKQLALAIYSSVSRGKNHTLVTRKNVILILILNLRINALSLN